jgi:hypothetical protein
MKLDLLSGVSIAAVFAPAAMIVAMATSTPVLADAFDRNASQKHIQKRIESHLKKLGMDGGCEIVIADNPDIVENTAAKELKKFLGKANVFAAIVKESQSIGKKRFLLGRESYHKAIKALGDKKDVDIRNVSAEDDGFHLKQIGRDIVVAGANPRGVLYGVYAFTDFIDDGATGPLDIKKVPYYRKRASAVGYYWDLYVNIRTDDFTEEKAAYLARLGVNQYTSCDDRSGFKGHLHHLVKSDVFPFQEPPNADYRRKVKSLSAICKKYGIDYYFFLWEPTGPQISADIHKYPAEAIGTVRPPYGGDKNGLERTLCVHSPIVQAHYRSMVKKFIREFSDVKGFFFYDLDGSTWLCTPSLCERCAAAAKYSPKDLYNPWESQSHFVAFLADAAHEAKPDFDFRFWGNVHFHDDCEILLRSTRGYDSLVSNWNGTDRDVVIPNNVEVDSAFDISRKISSQRGIPLYALIDFNNLEATPYSLPFPFGVCGSIKKYTQWGMNNIQELAGPVPDHNPINALVAKEFLWNPDRAPEEFLRALSIRQFGERAGPLMYNAWEEIRDGMNVWGGYRLSPLSGSQPYLSIGTLPGMPEAILPDIFNKFNENLEIRINVEPWRAPDYRRLQEKAILEKMLEMNRHLGNAAALAKRAVAAASDEQYIGICYYDGIPRPSCKEYAELNWATIAIADVLCRQRCNILRAYHLVSALERDRAAGNELAAKEKQKA